MIFACGPQVADSGDSGIPSDSFSPDWVGVKALFSDHCDTCHDGSTQFNLRAAIEEDLEQDTRLLVVPGDPEGSVLWDAVAGTTLTRMMPPSGRLPEADVKHVHTWIDSGAHLE